jgi:hypothetical protein
MDMHCGRDVDAMDMHRRVIRPGVWHNANQCAADRKSDSLSSPATTGRD